MVKLVVAIAIAYTLLVLIGCAQVISAKVYSVGGHKCWWSPGNNYSKWVKGKTFHKGDKLVFRYGEGFTVDEVTAEKFKTCDRENAIFSAEDGNTTIPLKKLGIHYFIGGAFKECDQGMNLTITVKPRPPRKNLN